MKCWKCGKENNEGSSSCIYCSSSLIRPEPVTKTGRAMRQLYDHYGPEEVLSNSAYLVNGLGDLLDDSKKLRSQLKMAADAGVFRLYEEQLAIGYPDPGFDKRVSLLMTEDAGLNEKVSSELAGYFDEMIGWRQVKDTPPSANTLDAVLTLLDNVERCDLQGTDADKSAAALYEAQIMDIIEQDPALSYTVYKYYCTGYKRDGHVIPKNLRKADHWLKIGAERDVADSMCDLAQAYENGGTYNEQDHQKALYWIRRAAEKYPDKPKVQKLLNELENKDPGKHGPEPGGSGGGGTGTPGGTQSGGEGGRPKQTGQRSRPVLFNIIMILAVLAAVGFVSSQVNRFGSSSRQTGSATSSSTAAQAAEANYSLTVKNGSISVYQNPSYSDGGTSASCSEGTLIRVEADDHSEEGYQFSRWVVTKGSDAFLTKPESVSTQFYMPAEDIEIEAAYTEWELSEWIPIIRGLKDYFVYNGKTVTEMSEADFNKLCQNNGIEYENDDSLDGGRWRVTVEGLNSSFGQNMHIYHADDSISMEWISHKVENFADVNALLPEKLPFKLGDSYQEACASIGASSEMATELLGLQGEYQSFAGWWLSADTSSTHTSVNIRDRQWNSYTLFFNEEDQLTSISADIKLEKPVSVSESSGKTSEPLLIDQKESAEKYTVSLQNASFFSTVENPGSETAYESGRKCTVKADAAENGWYFSGWSITPESLEYNDKGSMIEFTMPEENVHIEAVMKEIPAADWAALLNSIDDMFIYNGKSLMEVDQQDVLSTFKKAGLSYRVDTAESGIWEIRDQVPACFYLQSLQASGGVHHIWWEDHDVQPGAASRINSYLPETCPIRIGDTFDEVCEKLGVTKGMVDEVLGFNSVASYYRNNAVYIDPQSEKAFDVSLSEPDDFLHTYSLQLYNADYHYIFGFKRTSEDILYSISIYKFSD